MVLSLFALHKNTKNYLAAFFISGLFFLGSILIFPFFYGGDQIAYRGFYDEVVGLNLLEAFYFYREKLGTFEPVYFLFVYFCSMFFDKNIILSLVNFFLVYFVVLWMLRVKVNPCIYLLLFPNFYLMVLFFSAERLKFALVIFLLSFFFRGILRYFFQGISIFAHVQVVMLVVAERSSSFAFILKRVARGRLPYSSFGFFVLLFFLFIFLFVMRNHILGKLPYYLDNGGFRSLVKPLLFMMAAVFYAKDEKFKAFLSSFPLVLMSFFVGGERIVIFSYFVFMYYGLRYNGGINFSVLLAGAYFSFRGIDFICRVLKFGDGFYGVAYDS